MKIRLTALLAGSTSVYYVYPSGEDSRPVSQEYETRFGFPLLVLDGEWRVNVEQIVDYDEATGRAAVECYSGLGNDCEDVTFEFLHLVPVPISPPLANPLQP